MSQINIIDHPFRRRMLAKIKNNHDFDYHYFDNPKMLTGFRGFHEHGNVAEGERDFKQEARDIFNIENINTALDVGCAKGFLVRELRKLGVDAEGIDASEYAIDHCPNEIRPFLHQMNIIEISTEKKYDIIHCSSVLMYLTLSDLQDVLKRFHIIATKGIIVDVPTKEEILDGYNKKDNAYLDPLRKQELSQKEWDNLLLDAEFRKAENVLHGYYEKV